MSAGEEVVDVDTLLLNGILTIPDIFDNVGIVDDVEVSGGLGGGAEGL